MKSTSLIPVLAMLGLGIGAANAAPPMQPAHGNREPGQSMGTQERRQLSDLVKRNTSLVRQPKTEQEAIATRVNRADGTSAILVPESLWNNLSVRKDARGNVQVREGEGSTPAPATAEDAANE
jgi:hypothetical protein